MIDGFPGSGFLPFLKQFPELFKVQNQLTDNYEKFYQYLGITRDEMMLLMPKLALIDVLSDDEILEYQK